jgi:hypothetical protein
MVQKMKKIDKLRLLLLSGAVVTPLDAWNRIGMMANTFNRSLNHIIQTDGWQVHSQKTGDGYHRHFMDAGEIKRVRGEL